MSDAVFVIDDPNHTYTVGFCITIPFNRSFFVRQQKTTDFVWIVLPVPSMSRHRSKGEVS